MSGVIWFLELDRFLVLVSFLLLESNTITDQQKLFFIRGTEEPYANFNSVTPFLKNYQKIPHIAYAMEIIDNRAAFVVYV